MNNVFIKSVKQFTGLTIVPEYKFCNDRRWRFDYAIPEKKIYIEVDGGRFKKRTYRNKQGQMITTMGGRHNSGVGFEKDIEKKNMASILGWRGITVFPETLLSLATFEMIINLYEYEHQISDTSNRRKSKGHLK